MAETFAALFLAHVLADFVFQTDWIARTKQVRHPGALALHTGTVLLLSVATLGAWHPLILALTAAHLAIDLVKTALPRDRLWPFLADQGAHLATLAAVAVAAPELWQAGFWAEMTWLPAIFVLLAGLIAATRAGGFAIALLMAPFAAAVEPTGLPRGGALIGVLERGLIFLLVLTGNETGVGFLIAAKSILRFEATAKDKHASEYVIIGTLASFGWAMAAAWATRAMLDFLPPIGILAPIP